MHATGRGVPQNYTRALRWLTDAEAKGHAAAAEALTRCEGSPALRDKRAKALASLLAHSDANVWQARHFLNLACLVSFFEKQCSKHSS